MKRDARAGDQQFTTTPKSAAHDLDLVEKWRWCNFACCCCAAAYPPRRVAPPMGKSRSQNSAPRRYMESSSPQVSASGRRRQVKYCAVERTGLMPAASDRTRSARGNEQHQVGRRAKPNRCRHDSRPAARPAGAHRDTLSAEPVYRGAAAGMASFERQQNQQKVRRRVCVSPSEQANSDSSAETCQKAPRCRHHPRPAGRSSITPPALGNLRISSSGKMNR